MQKETIRAKGHGNVTARHRTTLEFTKEKHLTPKGDCILAIDADRGLQEFSEKFKSAMRDNDALLEIIMSCDGVSETVRARGHPKLPLTHPTDMVIRKSDFICNRTLAIKADKASIDLSRKLIEKLKEGKDVEVEFRIKK